MWRPITVGPDRLSSVRPGKVSLPPLAKWKELGAGFLPMEIPIFCNRYQRQRLMKTGASAMDLNQIRYYLNLAQTLNFTEAARQSGVSQPSLTRAIQRL